MDPEESAKEESFGNRVRGRIGNFFHRTQNEKPDENENGENWFKRKATVIKQKMDEIEKNPKRHFKKIGRDLENKFFEGLEAIGDWSSEKWDQFTYKFEQNWKKLPYNKTVGYLLIKTGKVTAEVVLFVLDAYVEANENR